MNESARQEARQILTRYGVTHAKRAADTDDTEEIILVDQEIYDQIDVDALTRALMDVLPQVKVWVAPDNPLWLSGPL